MKFEWDEEKNRRNIQKHRIDLANIPPVYDGPMYVTADTRADYGEDRMVGIGFLNDAVVVIVFVEVSEDTIRLISARKADKHEREELQQALGN
jgi:uncharacterized DUF497 family protein